ncbi:MAG: translation initiation factor IF-6 [Candidatus Woesearchaeota archaeon]
MHVLILEAKGNPNIGLFAYATDNYCLIGPELAEHAKKIEEVLQVPVHTVTIAGTGLLGVFLVGNNQQLLIPSIAFEHEEKKLRSITQVDVFETVHTALGNNLVMNENGILAGPMFSEEERERLAKLTNLPVHQFKIADIEVVGSGIVHNSKGGVIHRDANQFEIEMAEDTLGLEQLLPGTASLGSPYVRGSIVANKNGFIISESSGGPEITNADEALGFLER